MKDLLYILELGFSGSDLWRAVICAFFTAMLVNKKAGIWAMGAVALFVDRLVWPVLEQAFLGAEAKALYGSIAGVFLSLGDNLGIYIVRYLGLVVMISIFLMFRKRIHGGGAAPKKPAPA
ncbi:MAG: hypothetical protein K2Q06_04030 [Parvularculaceae bacterium]|nr:hypothetical protein [Parvularculaceae bacterium]